MDFIEMKDGSINCIIRNKDGGDVCVGVITQGSIALTFSGQNLTASRGTSIANEVARRNNVRVNNSKTIER